MGLTDAVTVTIIARRGMVADSLATAVSVVGPEGGLAFVNRQAGIAALIVVRGKGTARILESRQFAQVVGQQR
jgi:thiamine biosynthesis lipoprotein